MSDQALAQAQLPEDVHHDLHGCVVGDGEGAHVQDGAQLERAGAVCRQGGCMLGEVDSGVQHDPLLLATCVLWRWDEKNQGVRDFLLKSTHWKGLYFVKKQLENSDLFSKKIGSFFPLLYKL